MVVRYEETVLKPTGATPEASVVPDVPDINTP